MLYVRIQNGHPIDFREFDQIAKVDLRTKDWKSDWDWVSFEEVQSIARYLTAMSGRIFLGADRGSNVSPRFTIFEAPKIGDAVSYSFNGDTYPCGYITAITKKWQITTSEGKKFRRRGNNAGFMMVGGTWSMVAGHHYEQNPHF